jgi:hypothetical protein
MPELDIPGAATSGFRVVGRHFGAVMIWAVIGFIAAIVPLLLSLPQFVEIFRVAQSGGDAAPNPGAFAAGPLATLANLVLGLGTTVLIQAAVYRSVLLPEDNRMGYIRFGAAEVMLAVFTVAVAVVMLMILGILIAVFMGVLFAAGRNAVAGVLVGIPYWTTALVFFIWLGSRLALIGPMIVATGELRLGEAWALTKGRVLRFVLVSLVNFVIVVGLFIGVVIILIVVFGVIGGVVGMSMSGAASDPARAAAAFEQMGPAVIALVTVIGLLAFIGYIVLAAVFRVILFAPWADAYRQLTRTDTASTFA